MEKLRNDLLNNASKLIYGSDRNVKLLMNERLERVYLAANCRNDIRERIKINSKKTEVIELDENSDEIGVICKKPFSISVIGLNK